MHLWVDLDIISWSLLVALSNSVTHHHWSLSTVNICQILNTLIIILLNTFWRRAPGSATSNAFVKYFTPFFLSSKLYGFIYIGLTILICLRYNIIRCNQSCLKGGCMFLYKRWYSQFLWLNSFNITYEYLEFCFLPFWSLDSVMFSSSWHKAVALNINILISISKWYNIEKYWNV